MGITKPCTHLHPALSTSTQLHPAPYTSIQLISTSTQLHPPPLSSFKPPPSSLQHSQRYKNQNIARNWAISTNLGRKFKVFCLKIRTHGITGDGDYESSLRISKFRPQNAFLGKFALKK